ncbi:M23 family metallopeptidase [Paenibacillus sp. LHD-38]|uniref:M23 family metallopeptidase n=1 Tax=Paenibacillus sp. LHD-38 TaxID=3072143 RepID=UPI00280E5959|nr:M23 family metallopeptidase [Paenibacillus sp. LHD-38]MDQ8737396.1 M23 family metallopeptidase [Paenibacillus sp. LHD-38]
MPMKDSEKQRGQQKGKFGSDRSSRDSQIEDLYANSTVPLKHEYFMGEEQEELDPEVVWKTNPNPWASWGDENGFMDKRTFVKPPDLTGKKDPRYGPGKHSFRKELKWKLAVALLLFAAVWALFHYDNEYTLKGQALVKQALTDEIDFATAAAWYKETFAGAPSFIPIFKDNNGDAVGADGTVKLPIVAPLEDGSLVRTFAELLSGIELAGKSEGQVVAAETGRVLLLTEQDEKGSTIVIQHANQRVTVYGLLGTTKVSVNDWVEAGDPIGNLLKAEGTQPSLLYFAVKQNDLYIDPVGVIPID